MAARSTHRAAAHRAPADAGFTLIEVVVAIALVGIIATAGFSVVTRGLTSSASIKHTQTATHLANEAMERTRSVVARAATSGGVTGLVIGRHRDAVADQWARSSHPDRASTYQAHDPAATAATPPSSVRLPLQAVVESEGERYTVETLIGTCYRERENTSSVCRTPTPVPPPTSDTTRVPMVRVMVEVSWERSGASCDGTCTYYLTSLVDATADRDWLPGEGLQAVDDAVTVTPGTTVVVDVLANDIGVPASSNPVSLVPSAPPGASVDSTGKVHYSVPAGQPTGVITLTYQFKNTTGSPSNTAVLTLSVGAPAPVAADDQVTVAKGTSAPIAVLDNDAAVTTGVAAPVSIVTGLNPGRGSLSVSGGVVTYTANAPAWPASGSGTTTFTYRVTDRNGKTSNTATVTVTVVPKPVAASYGVSVRTAAGSTSRPVSPGPLERATGADPSLARVVVDRQPPSERGYAAVTADGQGLVYVPQGFIGRTSFTYKITQGGLESNAATIDLKVVPDAVDDRYEISWSEEAKYPAFAVTSNDVPATNASATEIKVSQEKCTTSSGRVDDKVGKVSIDGLNLVFESDKERKGEPSCTFTYQLISKNDQSLLSEAVLRVTFR